MYIYICACVCVFLSTRNQLLHVFHSDKKTNNSNLDRSIDR